MLIEVTPPMIIIKHSVEGTSEPYHTFAVWLVPEDPQELYDRALVASTLVQTFEGTYADARYECLKWLDRTYDRSTTTLWIESRSELLAVGKE